MPDAYPVRARCVPGACWDGRWSSRCCRATIVDMPLDRRQLFSAIGIGLSACRAPWSTGRVEGKRLDRVLEANVGRLPEKPGAGANHYPMAAEALEAMGRDDAIAPSWSLDAARYPETKSALPPLLSAGRRVLDEAADLGLDGGGLGAYERFAEWLEHFQEALARAPWQAVVGAWAPLLAPGLSGAAFHGLLRTAHAVRGLGRHPSPPRREELAVGLAYWAARYAELPAGSPSRGVAIRLPEALALLEHPWCDDRRDVDFFGVTPRLARVAHLPDVVAPASRSAAREDLRLLVREAAAGFLEMLVAKRHRIWVLHAVTGPAAVDLLLPHVEEQAACALVGHAQRAALATFAAFGEPYAPRAHVRSAPPSWDDLVARLTAAPTVHGVKLFEALLRFEEPGDPLWRSVAAEFLDWT